VNVAPRISFLCCAEVHQSVARHRHTRRRGINSLVLTSGWWVLAPKATSERTRKPSRQESHQSRSRRKQLEHVQVARPACGRACSPTRSRNDYTRHRHSSTHSRASNQRSIHSTASPFAILYNEYRQQPPTAGLRGQNSLQVACEEPKSVRSTGRSCTVTILPRKATAGKQRRQCRSYHTQDHSTARLSISRLELANAQSGTTLHSRTAESSAGTNKHPFVHAIAEPNRQPRDFAPQALTRTGLLSRMHQPAPFDTCGTT